MLPKCSDIPGWRESLLRPGWTGFTPEVPKWSHLDASLWPLVVLGPWPVGSGHEYAYGACLVFLLPLAMDPSHRNHSSLLTTKPSNQGSLPSLFFVFRRLEPCLEQTEIYVHSPSSTVELMQHLITCDHSFVTAILLAFDLGQ